MSEEVWAELYGQRAATHENTRRLGEMEQALEDLGTLTHRIERLESIILTMANGNETSYPNTGELHTHSFYPVNGARNYVSEIEAHKYLEPSAAEEGNG